MSQNTTEWLTVGFYLKIQLHVLATLNPQFVTALKQGKDVQTKLWEEKRKISQSTFCIHYYPKKSGEYLGRERSSTSVDWLKLQWALRLSVAFRETCCKKALNLSQSLLVVYASSCWDKNLIVSTYCWSRFTGEVLVSRVTAWGRNIQGWSCSSMQRCRIGPGICSVSIKWLDKIESPLFKWLWCHQDSSKSLRKF